MLRGIKRLRGVPSVAALGSVLLFAGCADTMMGGDKGMMKPGGGMMKQEGGMMKDGGMMKEEKATMEKKR